MLVALQKMLVNYGLRAEYGQFYDMPKSNHFLSQLHQGHGDPRTDSYFLGVTGACFTV